MNKSSILTNVDRLMVMRDLALLNAPEEPFFDRVTRFASQVVGTPVSLVSLVASDYQFFKSMYGVPEPWKSNRRTPLSHSFCQHVVTSGEPLIVEDAREVDLLKDNKAIPDLNVIGYLGMPLRTPEGRQLGSFCVIDNKPHSWTADEIAVMTALAGLVNAEIDARAVARRNGHLREHIVQTGQQLTAFIDSVDPGAPIDKIVQQIEAFRVKLGQPDKHEAADGGAANRQTLQ